MGFEILNDVEHIKKRPGMYIGDTSTPTHLLYETLDNALDELMNGYATKVQVGLDKKRFYYVQDNGRGIPNGDYTLEGETKPIPEWIVTKLFSGEKFSHSKYKKCLHKDTKVKLTDGRNLSMEEIDKELKLNKYLYVYSHNKNTNKFEISKILNSQITKRSKEAIKLIIDNNDEIICTFDHKFLMRDGVYKKAEDINLNDSFMPLYFKLSTPNNARKNVVGYQMIQQPDQSFEMVHKLADDYNLINKLYNYNVSKKAFVRHHIDCNKLNNNPENILRTTWYEHKKLHGELIKALWKDPEHREKMRLVGKRVMTKLWKDPKFRALKSESSKRQFLEYWKNMTPEELIKRKQTASNTFKELYKKEWFKELVRQNSLTVGKDNLMKFIYSEEGRRYYSNLMKSLNKDPEMSKLQRAWMSTPEGKLLMSNNMSLKNSNAEYQLNCMRGRILKFVKTIESLSEYNKRKPRTLPRLESTKPKYFGQNDDLLKLSETYNHNLIAKEYVEFEEIQEFYDIEIENTHNFVLDAGIVAHNSIGLNGIGLVAVNSLSSELFLSSVCEETRYSITSKNGEILESAKFSDKKDIGTLVSFIPNPEHFESTKVDMKLIESRLKLVKALLPKSILYLNRKEIISEGFISLIPERSKCMKKFIEVEHGDVKIVFSYDLKSTTSSSRGSVNLLPVNSGTHIDAFYRSLMEAWAPLIKNKDINSADVLVGLRAFIMTNVEDPSYSSQTKQHLTTRVTTVMKTFEGLDYKISKVLRARPMFKDFVAPLIAKFEAYRDAQNNLASIDYISKSVELGAVDSKGIVSRNANVSKLYDCTSKDRKGTELFIVEGDSACGPLRQVRDKVKHAILPLRGKLLNVINLPLQRALGNVEIRSMVNATGIGVAPKEDITKIRYEKVIVLSDADPDGKNIEALVIGAYAKLMPSVIEHGNFYVCEAPLFKQDGEFIYDKKKLNKKKPFQRFKGLGEMNPEELAVTALSDKRKLVKLEVTDRGLNYAKNLVGNGAYRKNLVVKKGLVI